MVRKLPIIRETFKADNNAAARKLTQQEGQRCPKRQAAIRLATAIILFRNKERNVRSPS